MRSKVLWDATPDIEGFEEVNEGTIELLPEKWRTKQNYGWRLDLDVELSDNYQQDGDGVQDKRVM